VNFARWSLLLSTLMFVTGLWFVLASPRGQTPGPTQPAPATVRQLMLGLVIPASTTIYQAAGTVSTLEGTTERAPRDDKEWEVVAAHAAVLIEASHLLRSEGRGVADAVWTGAAADMEAGARNVLAAAQAKNVDTLLDKGGEIVAACDRCHEKFLPGSR
jgi:dihydroxyacetone kinase